MSKLHGTATAIFLAYMSGDEILPALLPQMKFFCENEDILGCFAPVMV
jgi:hypothetical protein